MPESRTKEASAIISSELIALFSDLARLLGTPPSHGAIYGLLFSSASAFSMDEIIAQLRISKGSASQGLNQLLELGAVRRIKHKGERSARYAAELELRKLLGGFLHEQFTPHLERGTTRLAGIQKLLPGIPEPDRTAMAARLARLSRWHHRATTLLPLALQLLQDD